MGQYTEGQHLLGSDGKHYVVRNGVPVSAEPSPLVANPKLPLELAGQGLSNERNKDLLPYDKRKAAADAAKAELDLKNAQEQYNAQHPSVSDSGLYGDAFLKTVSPSDRNMVKALAEGRLAFPQGAALRAPFWQEKLSQVAQFDPTFDATNFNTRAQARVNAVKGKLGQSNNALNTAIGHLGQLSDQIGGTASHSFTPANAVINTVEQMTGDPGVTNFKDTAAKLADEMEAVYRNGGGAEQGVTRQLRSLDPNMSLAQKQGIVQNAMDLLASKMAANLSQYNFGTGGKPSWDMMDPHALQVIHDKAPGLLDKYFAPPSNDAGGAPPPGFAPPPTGPTNGGGMSVTPSTDGFNTTADPQSAAFWTSAVHQGTPYREALNQWQADVKARGLVGMTPPPGDKYKMAVDYAAKHPNIPYQPFSSVTHTPVDPLHQAVTDAAFSGPGVAAGHAVNALGANIPTLLAGDQGAQYNAVSNATHPNYAFGGDVAGTVAGAVGAQKLVEGAAPFLGAYGKVIAPNAARAALSGDTAFFGASGAAANPDHPVIGAAEGMASGMAGHGVGRYLVGPAFRAALDTSPVQSLINGVGKAKGMFGGTPLPEFAPPAALDSGQNMIFKRANPILNQIMGKLQSAKGLGLPYALADADPRLQALAGSAARKSPDALALANQVLVPRQAGQAERAIGQINNLAPVGDVPTMQANLLKQAQKQSGPLYDAAKAQPVPELTANPALKEILDRPAAQTAIRKGYETALNNGEDVGTLTYATDPQGNPVQYGNPSWNVIHHARRALDANGETAVRHALDKQIAGINPGFKTADAAYSSVLKGSDALQAGADATKIGVTPEQAQAAIATAGPHLTHLQQGYASAMADQVERSRLSGNPYNLVHGSLGQQAKMNMIFPHGADQFGTAHALETDMSNTYREALGGSQTAARNEADKAFDHTSGIATDLAMAPITHGASLTGLGLTGLRKGLGYLSDKTKLGMSADKAKSLAPYLLNTDPHANLILLQDIAAQQAARQAYLQKFGAVTGNVGSGMFAAPFIYGANGQ